LKVDFEKKEILLGDKISHVNSPHSEFFKVLANFSKLKMTNSLDLSCDGDYVFMTNLSLLGIFELSSSKFLEKLDFSERKTSPMFLGRQ
jgi:hypothetical protein